MKKQPYKIAFWMAIVITLGSFAGRLIFADNPEYFGFSPPVFAAVTFGAAYLAGLVAVFLLNRIAGNDGDQSAL